MKHTLHLPSGDAIAYTLERRQRRTVGLKITPDGLMIHAPKRITQTQLETIILEKSNWILKKLTVLKEHTPLTFAWENGETLMLLGQTLQLNLVENKRASITLMENKLQLATPHIADEKWIARKILTWYQQSAKTDFLRRLEIFSTKLGVKTPTLFLSNAKSRWGSCNSRREVRLNWRLIQAPPQIINYVVCHELAHLKEMNHSAKFWSVVESIFPEYKQAEKDLKVLSPQLHRIQ